MLSPVLQQIDQKSAVPSPPVVVSRLMEITADPNYRQDDVAKLLATDAGIAATLLRIANSALFVGVRKATTVQEALTRLGLQHVRSLVAAHSMIASFGGGSIGPIDLSYFWRRSLATAILSARLADRVRRTLRDPAFTAGLLADIGVIILTRALPKQYGPVAELYAPKQCDDFLPRELDAVGVSHAEVSAVALERWALPTPIVEAVRWHHAQAMDEAPDRVVPLARVLHGSSDIARFLCEAAAAPTLRAMSVWAMERVGLPLSALCEVLPGVESDLSDLANALKIEIIPSRVYKLLADSLAEQLAGASA